MSADTEHFAWCKVCEPAAKFPTVEIMDHLRLMHPDAYGDGPALWPDGRPVIVDTTLDPSDFGTTP